MFNDYYIDVIPDAHEDILNLTEYIYRMSFDVSISEKIKNLIYEKIYTLNFMPWKFQKILWDYRVAMVWKKYKIFYRIDEKKKIVVVVRVLRSEQYSDDII